MGGYASYQLEGSKGRRYVSNVMDEDLIQQLFLDEHKKFDCVALGDNFTIVQSET